VSSLSIVLIIVRPDARRLRSANSSLQELRLGKARKSVSPATSIHDRPFPARSCVSTRRSAICATTLDGEKPPHEFSMPFNLSTWMLAIGGETPHGFHARLERRRYAALCWRTVPQNDAFERFGDRSCGPHSTECRPDSARFVTAASLAMVGMQSAKPTASPSLKLGTSRLFANAR